MSAESAQEFLNRYAEDESFRFSIWDAVSDMERQNIVIEAGFNFTHDEIKRIKTALSQLSEQEIEKITGAAT